MEGNVLDTVSGRGSSLSMSATSFLVSLILRSPGFAEDQLSVEPTSFVKYAAKLPHHVIW